MISKINIRHWYRINLWPSVARELILFFRAFLRDMFAGIKTTGDVSVSELRLDEHTSIRYQPCAWGDLKKTLKPGTVSPDDVFIDCGSGKGA